MSVHDSRKSLYGSWRDKWQKETEKLEDNQKAKLAILESSQGILSLFLVMLSGLLTGVFPLQFQNYLTQHAIMRYIVIYFLVLYGVTALSGIGDFHRTMILSIVVFVVFVGIIQLHPLVTFSIFILVSIIVACFPTDFYMVSEYLVPVVILLAVGGFIHWLFYWRRKSKQLDKLEKKEQSVEVSKEVLSTLTKTSEGGQKKHVTFLSALETVSPTNHTTPPPKTKTGEVAAASTPKTLLPLPLSNSVSV